MPEKHYVRWFKELSIGDVPLVGGKNASLGEMFRELVPLGVRVPNGFAVTAQAFRDALDRGGRLAAGCTQHSTGSTRATCGRLPAPGPLPRDRLRRRPAAGGGGRDPGGLRWSCRRSTARTLSVAVRSSATAEDLPTASFAGQHETYLNVRGEAQLLDAVRRCQASLFTDRAISYRIDKGFDHFKVALSVGVQKMVRSDLASSGVMFSLDTETGFRDVVFITGAWGLGENVVQGAVDPDEFYVHKPTFRQGYPLRAAPRARVPRRSRWSMPRGAPASRCVNRPTSEEERQPLLPRRRGGAAARRLCHPHRGPLLPARRPAHAHGHRVGHGRPRRTSSTSSRPGRRR